MNGKMIKVADEFARAPVGRYISDGPNSGERFRKDFLIPALKESNSVVLQFDGTRPIGSSFLEEAFGGLRRAGFQAADLIKKLKVLSSDPSLAIEIKRYLNG